MKWTKDLPKEEGLYWLKTETSLENKILKETVIVEVSNWDDSFQYCYMGDSLDNCHALSDIKYFDKALWYGPLKEPK